MITETDFIEFWNTYPRRIGKISARQAYRKAIKMGAEHPKIMEAVERYKQWLIADHAAMKFVKHPATWLNSGGWDDELPTEKQAGKNDPKINLPEQVLKAFLRTPIDRNDLSLWLARCKFDANHKKIFAPTRFMADEIEKRFSPYINMALPGYSVSASPQPTQEPHNDGMLDITQPSTRSRAA